MNVANILNILKKDYPGKNIIENKNEKGVTTEIICEIEPTKEHPGHDLAISVIDSSVLHYHKPETYKVIKGTRNVFKRNKEYILQKGDELIIKPEEIHSSFGKATWVECYSKPGWRLDDHILIDQILRNYLQ